MSEFWRKLPHPIYGNYGGRTNTNKICCKPPIDILDAYFSVHDLALDAANNNRLKEYYADYELYFNLKEVEMNEIKIPIYGHLYFIFSLFIFGIIAKFGKPKEK